MSGYGKWIGGGLGWAIFGPIGGIIGFAIGGAFDSTSTKKVSKEEYESYRHNTGAGDFSVSLLVLSAAVMKADGTILKSELSYVKSFFERQFGPENTARQMLMLKDILNQEIPLKQVCEQIRFNMEHPLRLQLLHYLFGLSKADGKVEQSEVDIISLIANYLAINSKDFQSIKAMFFKDSQSAYKILEISEKANIDEIKLAYRKMAKKYHPDKVAHLGEEFQKAAKEKFQQVQDAYETIKSRRKF